jgi:hypothetical protein
LAAVGLVSTLGFVAGAGDFVIMAWLSLLVLFGTIIVLAIAVPKLKAKARLGWQLLYYSALFSFVYGLFNSLRFSTISVIFNVLWSAFWTLAILYVLFQVRSHFKSTK